MYPKMLYHYHFKLTTGSNNYHLHIYILDNNVLPFYRKNYDISSHLLTYDNICVVRP